MLVRYTMVNGASGSTGGLTAAKNRGGNYWRARVVPLNPSSDAQIEVRADLSASASAWRALTDAQRNAWGDYADSLGHNNAVGEATKPSGFNAYCGTNALRRLGEQSSITVAPVTGGKSVFTKPATNPIYDISDASVMVDISVTDGWAAVAGGLIFLFVGRAVSAGVTYYKSPFTLAAYNLRVGVPSDPLEFDTGVIGLTAGQKAFCRLVSMDSTGRISPAYILPLTTQA